MSARHSSRFVGAAVGGAVAGVFFWFLLNGMFRSDNVGWLKGFDAWWAKWYAWSAAGAVLAIGAELVRAAGRRRRAEAMERAAQFLGFEYRSKVDRERIKPFLELPIFQRWQAAENHLSGEMAGLPVEAFDYTYRVKGDGDSSDTDHRQTVVLLPAGDRWPAFELQPRRLGVGLMTGALGIEGVTFDDAHEIDRPDYAAFRRAYFLSPGEASLGEHIATGFFSSDAQERSTAYAREEEAVRKLFPPSVARFFAENPGWRLQCDGRYLALWKHRRLVSISSLPATVREALEIRDVLAETVRHAPAVSRSVPKDKLVAASSPTAEPLKYPANALGALIGVFLGFFGGGIAGMIGAGTVFFAADMEGHGAFFLNFALSAALFFGGAIGGLAFGAWSGRRFLSPVVLRAMQRRRERLMAANPDRPPDQPITSNATLENSKDDFAIQLPPVGLRRAGGCFLFLWCIGWNLFVAVFTAVFLPAALRGEVNWNEGPEKVSPVFAVLFLTPFWAIGLGALAFLIHRGRRRASIRVSDGRLMVEEQTLFGERSYSWTVEEVQDVRVDADRATTPPRVRLTIDARGEPAVRILGHRSPDELRWIADELRRELALEPGKTASVGA